MSLIVEQYASFFKRCHMYRIPRTIVKQKGSALPVIIIHAVPIKSNQRMGYEEIFQILEKRLT